VPTGIAGKTIVRASPSPRRRELSERLEAGELVVGVQVEPALGGISDGALDMVRDLPSHGVDQLFINAATSTRAQVSALSYALHVQQQADIRAALTVTTWDKSVMALQADMLGAFALGIGTVVCETGGPPVRGDYPNVDGVWELDDLDLLELLSRLNSGRDWDGMPLQTATSLTIGARCNPAAAELETEVAQVRAKIVAGAQFVVTRPMYEPESITTLLSKLGPVAVPMLVTVRPLRSLAEAELLRHEVPDTLMPEKALNRMRRAGRRAAEVGVELAKEMVAQVASVAAGVVIAGDNRESILGLVGAATAASSRTN
jgi:homocysteine S-methyltransferase